MVKLTTKTDRAPRCYTTSGGVAVPSVTEVLKVLDGAWMNAMLQREGRKETERILGEAATLGTRIHATAAAVCRDRDHRAEREMRPYARAVREFLDAHVKRVVAVELALSSERLGFGGTLDLYAELLDGSMGVVDWKSSASGITKTHKLQTAGYGMLLRDHGHDVHKRIVVRLHKADDRVGEWYARAATDNRLDVETFKACVKVWNFLHGNKLKGKAA